MTRVGIVFLFLLLVVGCTPRAGVLPFVTQEQRHFALREPSEIDTAPLPTVPEPPTVTHPTITGKVMELSLDEAIRIALANAKVVRVLAGTTAVSSGRTIYDPAIVNTSIDVAKAAFDPVVTAKNAFTRSETPIAVFDPTSPVGASIPHSRTDNYELGLGITKRLVTGGTVGVDGSLVSSRFVPGPAPLNPQERRALTVSLTQPLLKDAGVQANIAPIVIARINTERSYFQLKDSMQETVRSVVEAYWQVVFARTDVWARRQQVEQGQYAFLFAEAQQKVGRGNAADTAQAKVAYANFRASLVGAEANLLQREAALRNLLFLPPTEPERFVPTTPPTPERYQPKWEEIVRLAQEMRPDLIELALILEADQQSIIQARNQALPQLDATTFYRWNGLEGDAPSGTRIGTSAGQFADWTAGINFSVPIGLRQSRAQLRNAELVLVSDRANLEQGLHSTLHILAENMRNLAQFHEQYKAFQETRVAARINLEAQVAAYKVGGVKAGGLFFLNVLQAITDWGNAVSSEAQALAQYNIELANLERQTGTILETHGVRFFEERSAFAGPLGRLQKHRKYPTSMPPSANAPRYPDKGEPAEKMLERDVPSFRDPKEKMPMPPQAPVERAPPSVQIDSPQRLAQPARLGEPLVSRP
jgi:outer membrane protein TolC